MKPEHSNSVVEPRHGASHYRGAGAPLAAALAVGVLAPGCATGPSAPQFTVTRQAWNFRGVEGVAITTDHFDLYTTVNDPQMQDFLPAFLEETYQQYNSLLPPVPGSGVRLKTYLFAAKHEWLDFTRHRYPSRYDTYSRIQVGGYAAEATCVVQYIMPRTYTLSVIAHEGLHQYVAAHFEERIPAWLNEGLATYCEGFDIVRDRPVFEPEQNSVRRNSLRAILASDRLMPLKDLLATDAGRVIVNSQGRQTQAYYAQAWALMIYLRHGAKGRYADRLEAMLADVASGQLGTRAQATRITAPEPTKVSFGEAVFRAYITDDLDTFEADLRQYMVKLVGF